MREVDDSIGEVKRMYVDPEMRGQGIARTLALHLIQQARAIGYENSEIRFSTSSTYSPELRPKLVVLI
ncbi:MAG: GNAT family N-acetyltransferase [Gemmatimonadaceae bacterium]